MIPHATKRATRWSMASRLPDRTKKCSLSWVRRCAHSASTALSRKLYRCWSPSCATEKASRRVNNEFVSDALVPIHVNVVKHLVEETELSSFCCNKCLCCSLACALSDFVVQAVAAVVEAIRRARSRPRSTLRGWGPFDFRHCRSDSGELWAHAVFSAFKSLLVVAAKKDTCEMMWRFMRAVCSARNSLASTRDDNQSQPAIRTQNKQLRFVCMYFVRTTLLGLSRTTSSSHS